MCAGTCGDQTPQVLSLGALSTTFEAGSTIDLMLTSKARLSSLCASGVTGLYLFSTGITAPWHFDSGSEERPQVLIYELSILN